MTDFSPSDDELLSSFIDGDLTDEEATRLRSRLTAEPELRQRLDTLRGASTLVGSPVTPLSSEQSDSMIAAVLAASGTAENVTDLGAARAARSRWLPRAAVVAAGVALLAVAVPVLGNLDGGDDSDTASFETADAALDSENTDSPDQDEAADLSMDDSGSDGDADMADDEPIEMAADPVDDSDEGDVDSAMTFDGRTAALSDVFRNDALTEGLGGFNSEGELADEVRERFLQYQAGLNGVGPDDPEDSTVSAVLALQAEVGLANCTPELLDLEAENAPIVAEDYSVAEIGPTTVAIALYGFEAGDAVAYIIDPATCSTIDKVEIDGAG